MSAARLIGVDWGTSNLRVFPIGDDGRVLDLRTDPRGAGELLAGQFAGVLDQVAGDWLDAGLPVRICGMAGARGRWREMPYRSCPASIDDLARGLERPDPARDIAIVPGVAVMDAGGLVDVMRGEETQMMGLFAAGDDGVAVGPGTHSKWAVVRDGRIEAFRTFMTGELFAAIRQASVLSPDMAEDGGDDEAFLRGVERGLSDPAITAALFSVRVETLAGRLPTSGAGDYLSGLLIGAEIAAQPAERRRDRVVVVGAADLARRYELALAAAGFTTVEIADATEATARGLWRIWKATT